MKFLAVFDLDGVIYKGHSIFDLIQIQEKSGIIPKGTWNIIDQDLNLYKKKVKNYSEAANSMLVNYADSLKGIPFQFIKNQNLSYFRDNKNRFHKYFAAILKTLKKSHDVYIISTNFQFTVEAVCNLYKLDGFISSVAEVKNGKFTGKLEFSLAGNKGVIGKLLEKYPRESSIAVGDSENDIKMLKEVEFPVCFEPNDKLSKYAGDVGWLTVDAKSAKEQILKLLT